MAKPLTQQQQVMILGGILGVLAVFLCQQLVWRPQWSRVQTVRPQVARLRADIEQITQRAGRLGQMEQASTKQQERLQALEARFAQGLAVDTLVADLSMMAKAAHVRIESLEPLNLQQTAAEGSGGYYAEIPIQLVARGGYHQLGAFVNAMERSPRLMRLIRLEMDSNPAEPWRQSARIIVSAYRLLTPVASATR